MITGTALSLFGGIKSSSDAKQAAGINKGIAGDEQQINNQKQMQMQLEGRRMQMENLRNSQRLRAQATAAATNQGANLGSGLQGGLSQISDQSGVQALGINQNQEIGNNIFGINNDISSKKMQLADVQSSQATDAALMSLGGALVKTGGTIGGLSKDAYAWGSKNIGLNPGGPYV